MPRRKRRLNTPAIIVDDIVTKHRKRATLKSLAEEYGKPFKTIKNMCTRENNKERHKEAEVLPTKQQVEKRPFHYTSQGYFALTKDTCHCP